MKSTDEVGTIQEPLVSELGFTSSVKVFAGVEIMLVVQLVQV